ncbi:transmembrane alpha-helix domain-containing protein [Pochonia chlamydosporia 170]|uniref:Transmembrane alpha-helix domain-containing protein n=1 Tax=Pochonia chlamydosporia 170 TaxID=1380566 RepID=A0A179G904_METCM|nr:transmembrane alpha-helix domain-containing protein [Pochonia chlamydosporia 170]OAQ74295.1 transmembrane alpha-helix domain-containing protein [Pochonia chlamydosporia 170]
MKSTSVLATAVAALSTAVQGLNMAPRAAKQTASAVLADDGISPRPTPPPGWDRFEPENLFRRATTSKTPLTMMIAPDNTCGFISGSYAIPYTCGRSATCGIVQAQQTFSGMIMCFDSQAFNFRFACVDNAMYQSSSCDHLCAENTQILKCTSTGFPYCNTIAFAGNVTDYWCNSINYSTAQFAYTTYKGETDERSYSRFVQSLTTSAAGTLPVPTASGGETSTDSSTSSSASATQTGGNGGGGGGSSTPVGAIVGGVVGGVAAIGIGLLALFFILRRKKNAAGKSQPSSSDQSPMPPNATPGAPMTQAYYGGSPPPQGYPPQQYPQNTPSPPVGYYPQGAPMDPNSPTQSHMTDPRMSHMTTSPAPTWTNSYGTPPPGQQPAGFQPIGGTPPAQGQPHTQPQGPVHEAPAQTGENHRGQMHELA